MRVVDLDTPVLLIDKNIMISNIRYMQDYADKHKVSLHPYTKLIKCPNWHNHKWKPLQRGFPLQKAFVCKSRR